MNARTADAIAYALLVGAALVGVVLWPELPERMAIHFDAGGTSDDWVPKPVAVVLVPAIGVLAVLLTRYGPEWLQAGSGSPRVETASVLFVAGVMSYTQGFVYAWNLGYRLNAALVVLAPALVGAAALVVYAVTVDRP